MAAADDPKGPAGSGDYFIDSDTKDVLAEVVRFHRQMLGVKKLPVVNHQSSKYARDRYLLQWNGLPLDQSTLNTALRFLLHGAVIDSGGVGVHLTSHVLRHYTASRTMPRVAVQSGRDPRKHVSSTVIGTVGHAA